MRLEPGTTLGRYEVLSLLGAGGMGEVYRARDTVLARSVAVKVLPATLAVDADCLRRFEQEARAAAAQVHPGILAIYDVGVTDRAPYIVMELLEGATLRERMTAERLSVAKAVAYAGQVAEALAAAHDKGIVHRDLKPENLFVTAGDRVKILDFGLAKLVAPKDAAPAPAIDATGTLQHTVLRTVGYMAPEQARGQRADQQADIFSFGCVLYEMLQGQRAFSGETPLDTISAILTESPAPLVTSVERPMPPAVERIVRRCLEKNPHARFQSASDLAFALQSLSLVTEASPTTIRSAVDARPRVTRWLMRRVVTGAAALIVALALGAAVGTRLTRTPPPLTAEFLVPPPAIDQSFAPMPLAGLAPTSPQVSLSPDGRWLAFVASDVSGGRKLWLRALDASTPRPIERTDGVTSWPPRVRSSSSMSSPASSSASAPCPRRRRRCPSSPARGVDPGIIGVAATGGSLRVLLPRADRPVIWLEDWAGDGRSLVYRSSKDRDAWQLVTGSSEPRRLTQAREPIEQVRLSPDGQWIAYNTAESGRQEVYVSPVPATGQRWQVSTLGGVQATWRNDGRELYYLDLDGELHAVGVQPEADRLQIGAPQLLFRTPLPVISAVVEQYRGTSDGTRFLFCLPLTAVQREPLRVLLNWPAKLAQAR